MEDFVAPVDDELIATERLVALRAAIARLPERRRTAIRLRYEEGMTCAAIGSVLAMSTKSAEQLVALSVRALRKMLATDV
jgi:RNA polymerase sigma factor (sigma-70 family)